MANVSAAPERPLLVPDTLPSPQQNEGLMEESRRLKMSVAIGANFRRSNRAARGLQQPRVQVPQVIRSGLPADLWGRSQDVLARYKSIPPLHEQTLRAPETDNVHDLFRMAINSSLCMRSNSALQKEVLNKAITGTLPPAPKSKCPGRANWNTNGSWWSPDYSDT